jgi:ubiquitin thioesterase protein OTUB1
MREFFWGCTDFGQGFTAEVLALPTNSGRWKLWMAGYVKPRDGREPLYSWPLYCFADLNWCSMANSDAAAGFSYFETLVRSRNRAQLEGEIARMISLNNYLTRIGNFDEWMFEDMVEETTNLLKDLLNLVETSPRQAEELLLQRFNDAGVSNSIIYHFRLLASSWLKGNVELYAGFIPDSLGVEGYTKNWIEPVNQEIDHLGMTLLIDVLLKPIGFAVEIVYLDRSEGSQANSHIFQSEDSNGVPTNPGGPIIHLLYRPSHYDILYKDRLSAHAIPQNSNIQVQRATSFRETQAIQSTPASMNKFSNFDILANIPGFQLASQLPPQPSHHGLPTQFQSPMEYQFAQSPMSTSMSPISPGASSTPNSANAIPASYPVQPPPPSSLTSPTLTSPHSSFPPPTTVLAHSHRPSISSRSSLSVHSSLPSDLSSPSSSTSFRPSKYEWEAAAQEGPVIFQTSTFKNSHYNPAHYNNPNFQPEEWTPESEDVPTGRKRSS